MKTTKGSNPNKAIPCEFQIGGKSYTVKLVDGLEKRANALGLTHFDSCEIEIDSGIKNRDMVSITMYHELMHTIFESLGKPDLNSNEELVDSIANLLHQFHKTSKFD